MSKKFLFGTAITLTALAVGGYLYQQKQKADTLAKNKARLIKVEQNLMLFRLQNGRFPTNEEGIKALVSTPAGGGRGPYLSAENLQDIWGREVQYDIQDARTFHLTSAGEDGTFGTADDIVYPKPDSAGSE